MYYSASIEEVKFLIYAFLYGSEIDVVDLQYRREKEDWENEYPYVMQSLKNEIVSKKKKKRRQVILFEGLSLELLQQNFIELLIMLQSSNSGEMVFIILEKSRENYEYLVSKYGFLQIHQIQELDPEVYKRMVTNLILTQKWNRLSDVQAARKADENYKKHGATLRGMMHFYKEHMPGK